ncbi:hypothetical protein E4U39_006389 [Claviceps sp. Clav50 group G5]|nr:hypothetical protein E4U39_006389 [Claviceps sp. Clav50 group G5]
MSAEVFRRVMNSYVPRKKEQAHLVIPEYTTTGTVLNRMYSWAVLRRSAHFEGSLS